MDNMHIFINRFIYYRYPTAWMEIKGQFNPFSDSKKSTIYLSQRQISNTYTYLSPLGGINNTWIPEIKIMMCLMCVDGQWLWIAV